MMRDPRVLLLLTGLLGLVTGCGAGDQAGMDKRLRALEEEVTRLQNDNDRLAERVAGMETTAAPAAEAPAAPAAPAAEARPLLQVVRLEPGAAGGVAAAPAAPAAEGEDDDGAPRPVIRVEGARTRRAFEGVRPAQPESP